MLMNAVGMRLKTDDICKLPDADVENVTVTHDGDIDNVQVLMEKINDLKRRASCSSSEH